MEKINNYNDKYLKLLKEMKEFADLNKSHFTKEDETKLYNLAFSLAELTYNTNKNFDEEHEYIYNVIFDNIKTIFCKTKNTAISNCAIDNNIKKLNQNTAKYKNYLHIVNNFYIEEKDNLSNEEIKTIQKVIKDLCLLIDSTKDLTDEEFNKLDEVHHFYYQFYKIDYAYSVIVIRLRYRETDNYYKSK